MHFWFIFLIFSVDSILNLISTDLFGRIVILLAMRFLGQNTPFEWIYWKEYLVWEVSNYQDLLHPEGFD